MTVQRTARLRWPLAALVAAIVVLVVPGVAWAPTFMGGPSVRVNPNVSVEFKWKTDVAWFGKVELFANNLGTVTPILVARVIL